MLDYLTSNKFWAWVKNKPSSPALLLGILDIYMSSSWQKSYQANFKNSLKKTHTDERWSIHNFKVIIICGHKIISHFLHYWNPSFVSLKMKPKWHDPAFYPPHHSRNSNIVCPRTWEVSESVLGQRSVHLCWILDDCDLSRLPFIHYLQSLRGVCSGTNHFQKIYFNL